MAHQPMGSGGLDVDMITGRPRPKTLEAKQDQVKNHYQETVQEAVGLAADLQSGPALRVLFEQARARAIAVLVKDEPFMALSQLMGALRHKLEIAPVLAEQEVLRMMGPQMASYLREDLREEQAAPGGIPADE